MKEKNTKLTFAKRMDIWQEYRNEIDKESIRSSNWFSDDKKIKNYINSINNVDKNILANFDFLKNLKLAEVSLINEDQTKSINQEYKNLKFNLSTLNENFLSQIDDDMQKVENIKKCWYFLDEKSNDLNLEKINNYYIDQDKNRDKIKAIINENEKAIQNFANEANQKLNKLYDSIEKSKNLESLRFVEISKMRIDKTFNYKMFFFVIIGLLLTCVVAALICTILWLVL